MVVNSSRVCILPSPNIIYITVHNSWVLRVCRSRPEDTLNVPSTSGATRTVQHSNDGNLEVTQHPILSPGGPQLVVEVPSLDQSQVTISGDESFYTDLERRGVCRVKLADGSYREINFPQWPMCLTFRQNRYCLEPNVPAPKGFKSVEWDKYLNRGPTWDKWDASIRDGVPLCGKPTMSLDQLYRSPVVTYLAKLQQPTQVAMGRLGSVAHHLHNQLECFVTSRHHWKAGEAQTSTEFDASILRSLPQHTPVGMFHQPSQAVPGELYTTNPRPRYSVLHRENGYFVSTPRQISLFRGQRSVRVLRSHPLPGI